MKKWYYAPIEDAYIEVEDSVFELIEETIDLISRYVDLREDLSVSEIIEEFPDAKAAEEKLKAALTDEQWYLYKTAPIY